MVNLIYNAELGSSVRAKLNAIIATSNGLDDRFDEKAPLVSPNLTGTVLVPTLAANTNNSQAASTAHVKDYVTGVIATLQAASPATLDTLKEIADALNNDPSFAANMVTQLGVITTNITNLTNNKANSNNATLTGIPTAPTTSTADESTKIATTAFTRAKAEAVFNLFTTALTRNILSYTDLDPLLTSMDLHRSFYLTPERFGALGNGGDDSAALNACFTQALITGHTVRFDRVYGAVTNIASFHAVKKIGMGRITASANTYRIEPDYDQVNSLFVATTGNDTNDGLSAARPMLTLEAAITAIKSAAQFGILNGTWEINLAAGTFNRTVVANLPSIRGRNSIAFKGATVAQPLVPTTVIDGGGGNLTLFSLSRAGNYYFENIKFDNYANGYAISGSYGAIIVTKNVHINGRGNPATYGICASGVGGSAVIDGGIIKNCATVGVYGLYGAQLSPGLTATVLPLIAPVTMTSGAGRTSGTVPAGLAASITNGMYIVGKGIPDDTTVTISGTTITLSIATFSDWVNLDEIAFVTPNTGPVVFGCGQGIYAQEQVSLGLRFGAVFNCTQGISLLESSGIIFSSHVKGNTIGLQSWGSVYSLNGTTVVDDNTVNYEVMPSGWINIQADGTGGKATTGPYRLVGIYAASASHTGTTAVTDFLTLLTIRRDWFQSMSKKVTAEGSIQVNVAGGATAGIITLSFKLGTTQIIDVVIPSATAGSTVLKWRLNIVATGTAAQFVEIELYGGAFNFYKRVLTTVSFATANQALILALQLANAADNARIEHREVYVEGA